MDNGSILFCTRVLFHIAANLYRRTSNARPYGCDYKTVLSFREWQKTENLCRKKSGIGKNDNLKIQTE